jgi:hypothetical protein
VDKAGYQEDLKDICILGMGWTMVGGICRTLRLKNSLAVSGLNEIIKVFDDIERGKLRNIDFIEAYSCHQGCVGGSLTVENLYISYNKILKLIETLEIEQIKACPDIRDVRKLFSQDYFRIDGKLDPRPLKPLDKDLAKSIKKRKEKEGIYESLPKIDCGVCGAPTCMTFAEDVVKGEAKPESCIFNLPQEFADLSQELSELLEKSVSLSSVRAGFNKANNKKDKK